jgi:predicted DNA-binding transcriptional regulator YafY
MDRTERFYKIDQLLKDSEVVTFARFQDALGVSRTTLKRELVCMRDRFNAPIEFDRRPTAIDSASRAPVPDTNCPASGSMPPANPTKPSL